MPDCRQVRVFLSALGQLLHVCICEGASRSYFVHVLLLRDFVDGAVAIVDVLFSSLYLPHCLTHERSQVCVHALTNPSSLSCVLTVATMRACVVGGARPDVISYTTVLFPTLSAAGNSSPTHSSVVLSSTFGGVCVCCFVWSLVREHPLASNARGLLEPFRHNSLPCDLTYYITNELTYFFLRHKGGNCCLQKNREKEVMY